MTEDPPASRRVPKRWLNVLELVLDEGIEREGGIELEADDLRVEVPLAFDEDADSAEWGFDGSVTIETKGTRGTLAEWYHLHRESLPHPDGERRRRRDSERGESGSDDETVPTDGVDDSRA
ncbi:hypothetical protein Hbl1158_15960 (plasmid) [Halobaculum sp. CBA1158]|uniref:hypothetical protein n=1 Tax=Halobaculum sp. CBA1158 TaxID=2904243 RepID=UPI001F3914F7|nr:hypothetical protein [Halobaculum sp. CBA1158]UIP01402.1 hypothetical protein Hbl1158_15960 [Halobaculum sp. CBA1158]